MGTKNVTYVTLAAITFFSSFLAFCVQLIFSKAILPSFGGSALVWTTSAHFFQATLLLSYLYTFLLERLSITWRIVIHACICMIVLILLTVPLFGVPLNLEELPYWLETISSNQGSISVLTLGLVCVGVSFFFLGTVSTFVQVFAASLGIQNPYLLYRFSNIGSLLGIFSYPLLIEPFVPLKAQLQFWTVPVMILMMCILVFLLLTSRRWLKSEAISMQPVGTHKSILIWILLALVPVSVFLAITTRITTGVAPLPLLWVLPFGVYLLSYILAFTQWKIKQVYLLVAVFITQLSLMILLLQKKTALDYLVEVGCLTILSFIVGLLFHKKLYDSRPSTGILGVFYLCTGIGGLIGGLLVSIVAPLVFVDYWELPILIVICSAILLNWYNKAHAFSYVFFNRIFMVRSVFLVVITVLIIGMYGFVIRQQNSTNVVYQGRNFYGTVKVKEENNSLTLLNGGENSKGTYLAYYG